MQSLLKYQQKALFKSQNGLSKKKERENERVKGGVGQAFVVLGNRDKAGAVIRWSKPSDTQGSKLQKENVLFFSPC